MEINVSQEQGRVPVTVLQIKGELSAATAGPLQAQAEQAYNAGARYMLVDLSQVPFMSSAGLRVLHNLFNMLRSDSPAESDEAVRKGLAKGTFKSPHLKLLNPNKNVQQVLSTAGYDMFLEIRHNLQDAVASF
jgi:anti-anti-sigma factor